jgi:hypothetical protein
MKDDACKRRRISSLGYGDYALGEIISDDANFGCYT